MGLGTFGAFWCVILVHAKPSCPVEWWEGWAVLQKFLCVLISSQFLQQISLQVVFFFLAAFQALGHCNPFDILSPLLLPQLSFELFELTADTITTATSTTTTITASLVDLANKLAQVNRVEVQV